MGFLHGIHPGMATLLGWLAVILTPSLLALFPVASPQKSGRS